MIQHKLLKKLMESSTVAHKKVQSK